MPTASPDSVAAPKRSFGLALALVVLVAAAYLTSLAGIFVFDDLTAIVENPTIRDIARLDRVLAVGGAHGATVDGRPLLNLSFAVNYLMSGTEPWSYHAVNLVIHILATLALWAILRRAFGPPAPARVGKNGSSLAFAAAAFWALHPLQTSAVTYVVQRAESLTGLCYLLTVYFFVRSAESLRPLGWQAAAFAACLAGMACKEVMVSAPLIALLYDRVFLAGSWRAAWQRRGRVHLALMSTWLLLLVLVASTEGRGGTAGFATSITPWTYALTQCHALVHYLRLAFWPQPLVFDYGTILQSDLLAVAAPACVVASLFVVTIWALRRQPRLGFLGAWFFLILAPSSSVVPIATQTMAEHRMYLPLAAVIVAVVVAIDRVLGRRAVPAILTLAVAAGALTSARNRVYGSELQLWGDVVAKRPENARARTNLGIALLEAGQIERAIAHYQASLKLEPENAATHVNLCGALRRVGRPREAVAHGETAVRIEPNHANAHVNLALALADAGDHASAIRHYERALQLQPDASDVHLGLAAAFVAVGRGPSAIAHYQAALKIAPDHAPAWSDLARALAQERDFAAAQHAAERALQLKPDSIDALYVLGNLAAVRQDYAAAATQYRRALDIAPDYVAARNNLANVLLLAGQVEAAIAEYRAILQRNPNDASVQENLARALELQRTRRGR